MAQSDTPIALGSGTILVRGYQNSIFACERAFVFTAGTDKTCAQLKVMSFPIARGQLQVPLVYGDLQAWKLVTSQTHDAVSIVSGDGHRISIYLGYRVEGGKDTMEIRKASGDFHDVELFACGIGWTITDATGSMVDCGGTIPKDVNKGEGPLVYPEKEGFGTVDGDIF